MARGHRPLAERARACDNTGHERQGDKHLPPLCDTTSTFHFSINMCVAVSPRPWHFFCFDIGLFKS